MDMDRTVTRLRRKDEPDEIVAFPGTVEERLGFIWQLTKELYSLSGKYDVEGPMRRDITRIIRRGEKQP